MPDKEVKNIYQRLLAITEEIGKIEKTGNNTAQGYKFIEQARVVAEVRVQLAKHGVMIIPETVSRTMDRYVKTVPGYKATDPPKEQATYHANVVSRYTLVNVDNPEDKLMCDWDAGEALDTSDKATNKATTASQKYFLMKLFNISDQDDPDASTVEAPVTKPAPASRPTPAKVQKDTDPVTPKQKQQLNNAMTALEMDRDAKELLINGALGKDTVDTYADFKAVLDFMKDTDNE